MRLFGLTLCLLASSFAARAESLEDRVAALEARVKALEAARPEGGGNITAATIDGVYKGVLPSGEAVTITFEKGKATAFDGKEAKTATYEVVGNKVNVHENGRTETLTINGNRLTTDDNSKIEFLKVEAGKPAINVDGKYEATLPDNKKITLELGNGKAVAVLDNETKTGTYDAVGDHVVITIDNRAEILTVEEGHLKGRKGNEQIDFVKAK